MTDEQIRMLVSLGGDEAKLLLDNREYSMYRRIQKEMVKVVREYDVKLPLKCLQFFYFVNSYSQEPCWRPSQEALF